MSESSDIWKTTVFIGIAGTLTFHLVVTTIFLVMDMRSPHTSMPEENNIEFDFTQEETNPDDSDLGQYFSEEEMEEMLGDREKLDFKQLMQAHEQRTGPMKASSDLEQKIMDEFEREILAETTFNPEQHRRQQVQQEVQPAPRELKPVTRSGQVFVDYKGVRPRRPVHKELPAYLCKGYGVVTIKVKVNPSGKVIGASVDPAGTTTRNSFNLAEAKTAALGTRFNAKA